MTIRRAARPSHVRPRQPSTGRPSPPRSLPRPPSFSPYRFRRPTEPRAGFPLIARVLLVLAIVLLSGAVLAAASGILPRIIGSLGTTFDELIPSAATPLPTASVNPIPEPPTIDKPDEAFTNQPTVDISGSVPTIVVGAPDYVVRLFRSLPDQAAVQIGEVAVGKTPSFEFVGVKLARGRNDFSAMLVGPGGESDTSAIITYSLDQTPPPINLISPKQNATVNGNFVKISGKTQGRSTLVARNATNVTSATAKAEPDGRFSFNLAIVAGPNAVRITITDPAGNSRSIDRNVVRGSGKLSATLKLSQYRISIRKLPLKVTLTVTVQNPNGRPVEGAAVTFTLGVPGIPQIVGERTTNGAGEASFRVTIPKGGVTIGTAAVTVTVVSTEYGQAGAQNVIVFVT